MKIMTAGEYDETNDGWGPSVMKLMIAMCGGHPDGSNDG
jgi:hypothetical protein